MEDEKQITMKNGQRALSGTCPVCGTKMFKIGGGRVTTAELLLKLRRAQENQQRNPVPRLRRRRSQKLKESEKMICT